MGRGRRHTEQGMLCPEGDGYLRLIVVLDAHGEDVDAYDDGDEEVQVVAGAQGVDGQAQGGVVGIVGPLLGLWSTQRNGHEPMRAAGAL